MDNGIYIALSRQKALFHDMAVTTNNLANANTTGFQSEKIVFSDFLARDVNNGVRNKMAFANDVSSMRNTQEGPKQHTGNQLDAAIEGDGYFMLETPNGIRYTRAGNFSLNAEGALVSAEGFPVLDNTGQPLEFPPDASNVVIGRVGNISVNGEDFGQLGIAIFENPQMMQQTMNGLFTSDIEPEIGGEDNVIVAQGVLEQSNVQPVIELTHMIEVSRQADNTAKYIEALYDLQRKTTNAWTQQA